MKIENMTSPRGNYVPNQFIIQDKDNHKTYLQSYRSIVIMLDRVENKIVFGRNWDYSNTTGKYVNMFLREECGLNNPCRKTIMSALSKGQFDGYKVEYDEDLV